MAAVEKRGRQDANSPAVKLVSAEKRALIVKLRRNGWTLNEIAAHPEVAVGSHQAVQYHLDAHLAECRPSSEIVEELRQRQGEALDGMQRGLMEKLEDSELSVMERLAVTDRVLKVHERRARLYGLDLQPGLVVGVLTAEMMARAIYDLEARPVIEGTAEEITNGEDS